MSQTHLHSRWSRRDILRAGLGGLGAGVVAAFPAAAALAAQAAAAGRILVVYEMSGGNDGLNTLVPYADDAYYRLRPKLGIRADKLRKIDERFGFNPGMAGFEALYKSGRMAVIHGCGYDQPSFSHFTSMAYWHTGRPNSGEKNGWFGRLADAIDPAGSPNFLVNIDEVQSLAVQAERHVPVVFDDPERFARKGLQQQRPQLERVAAGGGDNAQRRFLADVARSAREASEQVREAWKKYRTPVDYGILASDLQKVAAMIAAGMPARLYYTAYRHNAFDTHVQQPDLHQRLLTYAADAVAAFIRDMERIGRADDVVVLVFSEFGRRAAENDNLGTDHGTANHMYVIGKPVRGGHYGEPPSLTALDEGGNLRHTTDFRRVYASLADGWMGLRDTASLLGGRFESLPLFG